MTTQTSHGTEMMLNLSRFHREHEKYYAQAPLQTALDLQRASCVLLTLADRWSEVHVTDGMPGNPYLGAEDLNETATIQHTGVLFLEGRGEPQEITRLKRELRTIAGDSQQTGQFLEQAMMSSWEMAGQLIKNPGLAAVLGERHRIIANDWQNASSCSLVAKLTERAVEILDHLDLSTCAVRADLAGPRFIPQYLYSAAELIDRAADLAAESATIVHENERRWRMFRQQVHRSAGGGGQREPKPDPVRHAD